MKIMSLSSVSSSYEDIEGVPSMQLSYSAEMRSSCGNHDYRMMWSVTGTVFGITLTAYLGFAIECRSWWIRERGPVKPTLLTICEYFTKWTKHLKSVARHLMQFTYLLSCINEPSLLSIA